MSVAAASSAETVLPSGISDPETPVHGHTSPLTGAVLPSYLTWSLPAEEGKYFQSEMNKMVTGQLQRNKPFEVTVLWKKNPKTVMIVQKTRVKHPKYGRYYDHIKKLQVHDPYDECAAGDVILIKQSRPYSKCKHHIVDSIVKKEIGHGHLDENPGDVTTNELRRVLEERKKAVRHSVVYMSDVQQVYLERELLRLDDSLGNAEQNARQAAQARMDRLKAIREAKEHDRQQVLAARLKKPRRSWEKLGTPAPWSFDPFALGRNMKHG